MALCGIGVAPIPNFGLCYARRVSGRKSQQDVKIADAIELTPDGTAQEDGAENDAGVDAVEDIAFVPSEDSADFIEASGSATIPDVLAPPPPTGSAPRAAASSSTSLEPVSALSAYMAQLANHAPISREEEHALAVRWVEEGDVDAARQMVLSNLRLVVKIAMEYRRAWTNTLDLIQEGNVGLMEAVQRYDPYLGVKLSSYAVYWIRAYVLKYILDNMRSVRLGTTRAGRKLFFQLNKEKRALELQGYEVTPKLLAERLDVHEDDVAAMESQLSRPDLSMDAPRYDDSGRETFGDSFSGNEVGAEDEVGRREMRALFRKAIDAFSESIT